MSNIVKMSETQKYTKNPFVGQDYLKIDKGTKQILAGATNKLLVNSETGETEGITMMHRYKEVDKTTFVKLYVGEVGALFELTKTGLKTFGFVLTCLKINEDTIYIYMPDLISYAGWKSLKQAYRGIGELIHNKIIAPSTKPNIWYINPNIVFNGDRIAFIKEYRLKHDKKPVKQLTAFPED